MNLWNLPTSLEIGGVGFSIRTDFRDVLNAISYLSNPDYTDYEKYEICLTIMYPDYEPECDEEMKIEMLKAAFDFIDMGIPDDGREKPKTMDWDQDAQIIIPAVNKVAGFEIRAKSYLHWWTFLSYYMEIGDGLFAQVVNIRNKRARGKKLEKWEREFEKENKQLIKLEQKLSAEEAERRKEEDEAAEAEAERILNLLNSQNKSGGE